jgi:4-hydroxyproline epimerase
VTSSNLHEVTIAVIDSHTGGEPTRVVIGGFPVLKGVTLSEQRDDLIAHHFGLARAVVNEPRGNEAMVGALLCEPTDPRCATGVIFFDRSAALGMCGHGTIGVVETLRFMGQINDRRLFIETPVGVIEAELNENGTVSIANVASKRISQDIHLDVPGIGGIVGDVAYGGNTFFLVTSPEFDLERPVRDLLVDAESIQTAAHAAGFTDVDHVELFGDPTHPDSDSRSFVLCPSGTYDRSPCGTGTSAKLACLAADGKLGENEAWIQESITGSQFSAQFTWEDETEGTILPVITGTAVVVARGELLISENEINR